MKIKGLVQIVETNDKIFFKGLNEVIKNLQEDGQEVEVQYSTQVFSAEYKQPILYNALVIGRVYDYE